MPWCSSMMLDGTSVVLVKSQIQGSNQSPQSTVWLELESTVWWIVGSSASRSGSQDHKVRPKERWRLWSEVMTTTMIFTSAHYSVHCCLAPCKSVTNYGPLTEPKFCIVKCALSQIPTSNGHISETKRAILDPLVPKFSSDQGLSPTLS